MESLLALETLTLCVVRFEDIKNLDYDTLRRLTRKEWEGFQKTGRLVVD